MTDLTEFHTEWMDNNPSRPALNPQWQKDAERLLKESLVNMADNLRSRVGYDQDLYADVPSWVLETARLNRKVWVPFLKGIRLDIGL